MIFTFYSFKGGVGRTQLVANLAAYLCYFEQKRILLIDWDLEAPGLHFYFGKEYKDVHVDGLIDVFQDYVALRRSGKKVENLEELPVFTQKNTFRLESHEQGVIDIIPAGNYSKLMEYKAKAIDFDWHEFYETYGGKRYLEHIKKKLKELPYDLIFIDSRTGLNDYSNICNIQMPDANILVVAPTNQNLEGCAEIAKSIVESPYVTSGKFRKDLIFPILSRIDMNAGKDKWQGAINKFEQYFGKYIEKTIDFDTYIEHTLLHHDAGVAFWENILFAKNDERSYKLIPIGEKYKNIACMVRNVYENKLSISIKEEDVKTMVKLLENADIIGFFDMGDKLGMDRDMIYNELKNSFITGGIKTRLIGRLLVFTDAFFRKNSLFV